MSNIPAELKYLSTHEWLQDNGDGTITVGITDHAQQALGDVVYVELPVVGATVTAGAACAVVESVKAASDIYSPLTGTITAINPILADNPEQINAEPYTEGWLFRIAGEVAAIETALDADAYAELLAEA